MPVCYNKCTNLKIKDYLKRKIYNLVFFFNNLNIKWIKFYLNQNGKNATYDIKITDKVNPHTNR